MNNHWSFQDAKNNFEEIARLASEGLIQTISNNDEEVVVISYDKYENLINPTIEGYLKEMEQYKKVNNFIVNWRNNNENKMVV